MAALGGMSTEAADRSHCLQGGQTMRGFSWWSDFHCPPPRLCAWAGRMSTGLVSAAEEDEEEEEHNAA